MRSADIYITNRCGLVCKHCFMGDMLNTGSDMTTQMVRSIGQFLQTIHVEEVTLLGGEPFQHPHVQAIVQDLVVQGFHVRIVTNGHRPAHRILSQRRIPKSAEIFFSLDGDSPASHDGMRKDSSFSVLIDSVRAARSSGHRLGGILSVGRTNFHAVAGVLELADSLGFEKLTVHHITARGNAPRSEVLGRDEWEDVLSMCSTYASRHGMVIRCEDPFFSFGPHRLNCILGTDSNYMFFPDGRVFTCLLFLKDRGGNGMVWNGSGVSKVNPAAGELLVKNSGLKESCPAADIVSPPLYPEMMPPRVRCIYDKIEM